MSTRRPHDVLILMLSGLLCSGCEASTREIDEDERGDLILSGPVGALYRLDRRVEQVLSEGIHSDHPLCGHLTERAAADIDRTLAELDPEANYQVDIHACEDEWADGSGSKIHIDGFTYSPFVCGPPGACCDDALIPLAGRYNRLFVHLAGNGEAYDEILEMHGVETYPMIEPDEPCR